MQKALRFLFFLAAAIFALQIIPGLPFTAKILPGLSPYLEVCSAIARRSLTIWSALALPVVLISFFRGRWFCRSLCPTGFLAEQAGRLRPLAGRHWPGWPQLNRWIALAAVAGAAVGYPILLWLDPLSIFNAFFGVWTKPMLKSENLQGMGLLLILGLSLWRPGVWCYKICPLGYGQEFLGGLGRRIRERRDASENATSYENPGRRAFLFALLAGLFSLLLGKIGALCGRAPMRPPGAAAEEKFKALCVRCGNCIRTCPQKILHAEVNAADPAGFLTPVVGLEPGYCFEYCKQCSEVCPTGAIRSLALKEKQRTAIGLAEINRSTCLAWANAQYCMICSEFCPYHAIRAVRHNGANCPEVDPEICRGCGACQVQCPTWPKTIVVRGRPQKLLKAVEV